MPNTRNYFIVLIGLLAAGCVLASYLIYGLVRVSTAESRHNEALVRLHQLAKFQFELSANRRGLVLTNEDRYFQDFLRTKDRVGSALLEIHLSLDSQSAQQERWQEARTQIEKRIADLGTSIELKRSNPADMESQIAFTIAAFEINERIANLIGQMVVHEEDCLRAATQATQRAFLRLVYAIGVIDLLALVLVVLASIRVFRDIRQRALAHHLLQSANEKLELAVAARTNELVQMNHALRAEIGQRVHVEKELREHAVQLEALTARVVAIQECERARLARELHDEIGQVLTAVSLSLQAVRSADRQHLESNVANAIQLAAHALSQVREFSLALRPALLDELGLVPALRWLVDRESGRANLKARVLVSPGDLQVEPQLATVCFRIVQESITNVIRHAQASQLTVELTQTSNLLNVSVVDNGVGFVVQSQVKWGRETGQGLIGIRERVALVGGNVEIISKPGEGTRIDVHIPIPVVATSNLHTPVYHESITPASCG